MNKREKEVLQAQLDAEKAVLKELEKQYKRALSDIEERVKLFDYDLNRLDTAMSEEGLDDATKSLLQSQRRSRVYQKQYQEALRGQINGILDKLHGDEYATIQQYLDDSYTNAFIGTMYDIAGQGVPLILPIDQAAAVRAVQLESKVSKGYYDALGVDINDLKKTIKGEVSRGIATGMNYSDIARNINNAAKTGRYNAQRIARTEGHRIQQASTMDAQNAAKAKGAEVVKQWDATLDGKTRPTHRHLDGQIREIDEFFEVGGMKAKAPGYFGRAAEDINCRCVSLTRARWALDEDELDALKDRAAFYGLDKAEDFEDYTKKYLVAANKMAAETDTIGWPSKRTPITAEQYKGVMGYAREKGIELAGFKEFDGDIDTVYELVDDAVSIANLYPKASDGKKKMTIKLSRHMKSVDFAKTEGRIIEINADAFRDTKRLAEEYDKLVEVGWFVKGTDYRSIVKHEMGHVVANTYNIDVMSVAEKVTGLRGSAAITTFYEEHLSEYAGKYSDGSEIISECFASVFGSKEKNKFALQFVEECDRLMVNK